MEQKILSALFYQTLTILLTLFVPVAHTLTRTTGHFSSSIASGLPLPSFVSPSAVPSNVSSLSAPKNTTHYYRALYQPYSNSTPVFHNLTGITVNPPIVALNAVGSASSQSPASSGLLKRQNGLPVGTCAPGTPCSNGACCSNTGICGYSPDQCGTGNCISNCDAKAQCGEYGVPGAQNCPINVCCSQFGFCGSTEDFCGTGCQGGYGGCGNPTPTSCTIPTIKRTVGYYESWSPSRPCDGRSPADLDITAFTHLTFAFAYFDPTTLEVVPMNAGDQLLYPQFTGLKLQKPSLQTWISIGGWSYNDAGNSPNTQQAFSNMAASSETRQTFISSLLNFVQTYGFDGVDFDWEYPGAPDRGGSPADTANFVTHLSELRTAFGNTYGISATIPSSYWYMQWFDLSGMEQYLDWFNFMSYDIHGVWDASNPNTGPYLEPHTNLTEIDEGLDLLWRNNIDPSKVTLGIGWYGRSFTLADPSCSTPGTGCVFTQGGDPGPCTATSGILSNAEILDIITKYSLEPFIDTTAAIKWITWNSNQWVSYDDGGTIQLKIKYANDHCLGEQCKFWVWAVDFDDDDHTSSNNLLGVGTANGVTVEDASSYISLLTAANEQNAIQTSCFWSSCGEQCPLGYIESVTSKGQFVSLTASPICTGDEFNTLCCAPGTTMGDCAWEGWRGVGMPCASGTCSDPTTKLVARNTNNFLLGPDKTLNQTCNGGFQNYCCNGFVASSKYISGKGVVQPGTPSLSQVGQLAAAAQVFAIQAAGACISSADASFGTFLLTAGLGAAAIGVTALSGGLAAPFLISGGIGLSLIGGLTVLQETCTIDKTLAAAAQALALTGLTAYQASFKPTPQGPPTNQQQGPVNGVLPVRNYAAATYTSLQGQPCTCRVTYICQYGGTWDEVCDNQRYAIEQLGVGTVFKLATDTYPGKTKADWSTRREDVWRTLAQMSFHKLHFSKKNGDQAVRLVNGDANGDGGLDFKIWKMRTWSSCKTFLVSTCQITRDPPITWGIGGVMSPSDPRAQPLVPPHFIQKYGFDSQVQGNECWATYSSFGQGDFTTVLDQGFRVYPDDPMFGLFNYPLQTGYDYGDVGAAYIANAMSININSAFWLKKRDLQIQETMTIGNKSSHHSTQDTVGPEQSLLPARPQPVKVVEANHQTLASWNSPASMSTVDARAEVLTDLSTRTYNRDQFRPTSIGKSAKTTPFVPNPRQWVSGNED